MALTLDDKYVSPAELTGYVRSALEDLPQNTFSLNQYLPDTPVDDIDWRGETGGNGLTEVAQFRSFDAESPIGSRPGVSTISGSLPPISEKIRLGEYDRLKLRNSTDGIKNAILDDGVRQARKIKARAEVGRGELLMTGKVTIAENGLGIEADFGRKASHSPTAAILWSAAGSTPIDDLLAWVEVYRATNGIKPEVMLVAQQVVSVLMRNEQIRALTLPAGSTVQIVTIDAIQALLRSYGLPPLEVYEAQVAGPSSTAVDILDPTKILFLPPAGNKIGETQWGITAEQQSADYNLDSTIEPGIVVGSYSDNDPVAQWTKASAIMLPIAPNTNLTLAGKVL
ncbi:major capsid protein [Glutamicibacter halophytocola]|uniref:Major capsid protein n=1 Tax=Glutamicibacter halophytocola TaxID=1933880 RepID=A0AA94XUN3_9MICC|nr:major capsid protein [Glutamicibacter halophytocola]UUX60168.1 major capsid protein [Glutamicibacter halophytocola]